VTSYDLSSVAGIGVALAAWHHWRNRCYERPVMPS
jgi:hypothetical protein